MPFRQVEPEPEKKRGRARYDDDTEEAKKKVDARGTLEAVRLMERNPRNLDNKLQRMSENNMEVEIGPDTMREFDSVEVRSGDWTSAMAVTATPVTDTPRTVAAATPVTETPATASAAATPAAAVTSGYRRPRETLSVPELDWMNSEELDVIPDSQETQDLQGERLLQLAEDRDAGYEIIQRKNVVIEQLRSQLDNALSMKEEYWEKIGPGQAEQQHEAVHGGNRELGEEPGRGLGGG